MYRQSGKFLEGEILENALLLRKKGNEVKLFPVMRKIPQCLKEQHFVKVAMLNTEIQSDSVEVVLIRGGSWISVYVLPRREYVQVLLSRKMNNSSHPC